jgi:hypothetical protein
MSSTMINQRSSVQELSNAEKNMKAAREFISLNQMPVNEPSICIPSVFITIGEQYIVDVIDEQNWGEIARVDKVNYVNKKGQKKQRVFIHFRRWYFSEEAKKARLSFLREEEIQVVYDGPWYWNISINRHNLKTLLNKVTKAAPLVPLEPALIIAPALPTALTIAKGLPSTFTPVSPRSPPPILSAPPASLPFHPPLQKELEDKAVKHATTEAKPMPPRPVKDKLKNKDKINCIDLSYDNSLPTPKRVKRALIGELNQVARNDENKPEAKCLKDSTENLCSMMSVLMFR